MLAIGFLVLVASCVSRKQPELTQNAKKSEPSTLDLREPMGLAAQAIAPRLDAAEDFRPWFKLRGRGGIPVAPEHDICDFGDMTGRYLEGLILARRMGVSSPELSLAEGRLGHY